MLDVGAAIRVRRLARTLDAARALGKPIDAATVEEAPAHVVGAARRALDVPRAGRDRRDPARGRHPARRARRRLAYEILNVLRDTQLYVRPSGLDVQLAFGEGYLQPPRQA